MAYMNTDIPELGGFDTGLVLENLALILRRQAPWLEASITQLWELAHAILQDASGDTDTLQSILLSLQGHADQEPSPDHPDAPYLYGMEKSLGIYQKLLLYHFLHLKAGTLPLSAEQSSREVTPTAQGKIAYMKGTLVGKAYMKFSAFIQGCRALDFHSFADACEEVQNGLCEYCILPLHSSTDGQLMSFYRLIIKYRLQIVAVCDVHHKAGGHPATTTFGLLRSMGEGWDMGDLYQNPFLRQKPTGLTLSLLYTPEKKHGFGDILVASEFCGVPLIGTGTLPFAEVSTLLYGALPDKDTSPDNAFTLMFELGELTSADPSTSKPIMPHAFLSHLMLEASEHFILGLYPTL